MGSMFGPYHLKRLLGRGGMGEVYEAENTVKEWPCAVKLMTAEFSKDPVFRERMKREARTAGRLQEPHVVPIHDYGEIDGQMYLEMRLIEGTDLDTLLKRFGPLTPPRAVAIISQVASALDAAHAAGVMHRDVKPPNVLVTRDDFAYLVDFGIASATTDEKLTQLGTAVGTWKYMAPERFSNDEVTYRADIYALACVLYECLTGSPPYRADSASTLVTAHLMDPVPQASAVRSGIPKGLDAVIARGMAKRPEDRYASAGDFARAAHDALSDPDQDHAADILRRSQEATLPGTAFAPSRRRLLLPHRHRRRSTRNRLVRAVATGEPDRAARVGTRERSHSGRRSARPGPAVLPRRRLGGTPPGTPPQQLGGPAPWNQPASRQRNPWPIVAGAAALVVVLVVAAIGVWLATRPDSTPKADTTTSVPTTKPTTPSSPATTTPAGDPQSRLMSYLPSGYTSGTCTPTSPKPDSVWTGATAMYNCGQNTNQGGPSRAIYGLFPTLDALKKAFNDDIAAVDLMNCPGEGPSPDGWHYDRTPNVTAGMIACGTYKNHPNVIWTNEEKLMLSDVFGDPATIDELHTWWAKYG
ncbi:putative serine/threonine-protein kinase pknH [Mycobacterium kansasii]|uniref:non-specific serine/threonine protein kinase n=1 Tax=Mycobacterium kansasii TaxID=1768 RepID=A0A1V3XMY1_MYCKA|nr:putative serine/threonine-protein kinase pknH [Mycobacterium kansasii]